MSSYVVSIVGAVKVLSFPRGLCGGSIDINLAFMSKEVANQPENTFNCLHTYPNIAWEDPGPVGDGDFLKNAGS